MGDVKIPKTFKEASLMNYEDLKRACDAFNQVSISGEEIKKSWDAHWEDGFDTCLTMVLNMLDSQESNEIAKMSTWEFIEVCKSQLLEQAQSAKKGN